MALATLSFALTRDTEEVNTSHQHFILHWTGGLGPSWVMQKAPARILGVPLFPSSWFVSGQWEVGVLAELLCTAGAAKGGEDVLLPGKGSVTIPEKENAAEAMKDKLKGNQNGNNTASETPYHSYHFLEIKSEIMFSAAEKKQTLLSNPPSDGYKLLISSRPTPSKKDALLLPLLPSCSLPLPGKSYIPVLG